ncbi:MAG: 50S ribosomal protein L15e [Thaumarchaeota archaeon]|nr:50S ribosomal protein L15e [Nitrososphaerota archaeon]MCL5319141.1 50S ribosomal protein L15e [Nitrososphaerota archaeon]
MYRANNSAWRKLFKERSEQLKTLGITLRQKPTIERLERPSRLDRARRLGYKAKPGFVVVRVKVGRGGMRRLKPDRGRRPKHSGLTRMKADVNVQQTAERRATDKFPNLKALNSYYLFEDGKNAWYEVILIDTHHPSVISDKNVGVLATQ